MELLIEGLILHEARITQAFDKPFLFLIIFFAMHYYVLHSIDYSIIKAPQTAVPSCYVLLLCASVPIAPPT